MQESPLSLDSISNNFPREVSLIEKPRECPHAKLWIEGVDEEREHHFFGKLRCKSWACVFCAELNSRKLREDLQEACEAYLESKGIKKAAMSYHIKLVTLTLPGRDWRSRHSIAEAEVIIKKSLLKLMKYLTKAYHVQAWVWVREYQRDGYPHLHLLIMGPGVVGIEILGSIRERWCGKMGLGNIDIKVVRGVGNAVFYICKYLTKGMSQGVERSRVFGMSQGFKNLINFMRKDRVTVLALGVLNSDGTRGRVLWQRGEWVDPGNPEERQNFEECIRYFQQKVSGCQTYLFN